MRESVHPAGDGLPCPTAAGTSTGGRRVALAALAPKSAMALLQPSGPPPSPKRSSRESSDSEPAAAAAPACADVWAPAEPMPPRPASATPAQPSRSAVCERAPAGLCAGRAVAVRASHTAACRWGWARRTGACSGCCSGRRRGELQGRVQVERRRRSRVVVLAGTQIIQRQRGVLFRRVARRPDAVVLLVCKKKCTRGAESFVVPVARCKWYQQYQLAPVPVPGPACCLGLCAAISGVLPLTLARTHTRTTCGGSRGSKFTGHCERRAAPVLLFLGVLVRRRGLRESFGGGFQAPFPPAVAHRLLLSSYRSDRVTRY